MFNQKLNDQYLDELREYCRDKRVIIVGNSASMLNDDYGSLIDSYDVVVRFGKGVPVKRYQKNVGSKTDVWMFASFRAGMYEHFKNAKFKVMNFLQVGFYDPVNPSVSFPTVNLNKGFEVYNDYFVAGSFAQQKLLCEIVYPKADTKNWRTAPRISQGLFGIVFFQEMVKTYKELGIIGFDFFESQLNYRLQNDDKKVWSWHVPIPVQNTTLPHEPKRERAFVEARANDPSYRTKLYDMNTFISKDLHDKILRDLRPNAIPLEIKEIDFPEEIVLWISNSCPACHMIMEKLEDEGLSFKVKTLGVDYTMEELLEKVGRIATPSFFDTNDNYLGDGKYLQQWVYWKKGMV